MSFIEKLDGWIINKIFQPVADWFMNQFSISNFQLAGLCFWIMGFGTAFQVMFLDPGLVARLFDSLITPVTLWYGWRLMTSIDAKLRRLAYSRLTMPAIYSPASRTGIALVFLLFLPQDFQEIRGVFPSYMIGVTSASRDLAIVVVIYLVACVLKPPKPKKAKVPKGAYATGRS